MARDPKLCAACGYSGTARRCPICGTPTVSVRSVQEAGTEARAAQAVGRDEIACPRCASVVPRVPRDDLPVPPPPDRLCAPCGYSGPAQRCPDCSRRTVALPTLARAERGTLADDAPPTEFPRYDETLADQLPFRCGPCLFLFAPSGSDATDAG